MFSLHSLKSKKKIRINILVTGALKKLLEKASELYKLCFNKDYKLCTIIFDLLLGFSPKFVKSFKNGFPVNWNFLVADHFNSQSRLVIVWLTFKFPS